MFNVLRIFYNNENSLNQVHDYKAKSNLYKIISELIEETKKFEKHLILFDNIELVAYYNEVLTKVIIPNLDKIFEEVRNLKIRNVLKEEDELVYREVEKIVKEFLKKANEINPYDLIFITSSIYLIPYFLYIKKDKERVKFLLRKIKIKLQKVDFQKYLSRLNSNIVN